MWLHHSFGASWWWDCGLDNHPTSHAPKALTLSPPTATINCIFFFSLQAHTRPAAVMVGGPADWSTILLTWGGLGGV